MRPIPIKNTQEADPNRMLAELIAAEEQAKDEEERRDLEREKQDA